MLPTITKRIDLNVGYSCNMRCRFCYYQEELTKKNDLSTEQCKKLISLYRKRHMETLDITGGEPTIRKDLFELVRYAKAQGFKKIAVITNGLVLSNPQYAADLVSAGVNDFLFSLHGSTAETHDYVTCVPKSFERLNQAIKNLLKLNVKVRCNSVVTGATVHDTYARAKLFKELGVKTVNFIMYNPIEQQSASQDKGNFLKYQDAATQLQNAIRDFGNHFDKFTIRYIPLCLMPGMEQHVQNVHQVHYDHDEWNYYLRAFIREPYWKWLGGISSGLMLLPQKTQWTKWGWEQAKHAAILEAHSWLHKHKFDKCKQCRYSFICGGVWKQYAKKFGDSEIKTIEGDFILEPWHFMNKAQRAEE